jgi:general stress protein 26
MTDTTAPSSDIAAVAQLLRKLDICMLTTRGADGTLRGRPMSNNGEVEFDGDTWFFAQDRSRKVTDIDADPSVELAFIDTPNGTWVNVEGHAQIVRDDTERKRRLWLKDLERWFENGPEDPEVVLIKVSARHVDAWGGAEDRSFDLPPS